MGVGMTSTARTSVPLTPLFESPSPVLPEPVPPRAASRVAPRVAVPAALPRPDPSPSRLLALESPEDRARELRRDPLLPPPSDRLVLRGVARGSLPLGVLDPDPADPPEDDPLPPPEGVGAGSERVPPPVAPLTTPLTVSVAPLTAPPGSGTPCGGVTGVGDGMSTFTCDPATSAPT
jgi:hypothetical protein